MKTSLQYAVRFANFCMSNDLQPHHVATLVALGNTYASRRKLRDNGMAHGGVERARQAFVKQAAEMKLVADPEQDEAWTPVVHNEAGDLIRLPYED